jgi:peptidyl-prolyl cis-trans isomerase SurA
MVPLINSSARMLRHSLMLLGLFVAYSTCSPAFAQRTDDKTIDRILAIVDEDILLQSELETQYEIFTQKGGRDDGTQRCTILENMVMAKLLLAKAKLDSLKITDEQVESELNRRIGSLVQEIGSVQRFEQINGRSMLEFKNDLRPRVKDQILMEMQKNKIYGDVSVTPREVKTFFEDIPRDSLPFLPAEVEMSHIVIIPKASRANVQRAREDLGQIRRDINSGLIVFEAAAKKYSDDIASARQGGYLGEFGRGDMVPEFEDVVYNLKEGQVSEVFESSFGFHIIRLNKRTGDRVEASHILVKPRITSEDDEAARQQLLFIRSRVLQDSLTFSQAAARYSNDKMTKDGSGMLLDAQTGEPRIPLDRLPADLFFKIDPMTVGQISEPLEYLIQENEIKKAWQIIFLRNRTVPHRANLKDDYQKFYKAALQSKQAGELDRWFSKAKEQVFVDIKPGECFQALQDWNSATNSTATRP